MYLETSPSNPGNDLGDGAVIRADDLAQILGIQTRRERSRPDQVAKHHCQLPAFGIGRCRGVVGRRCPGGGRLGAERSDGVQELAAGGLRAPRRDP